MECITPATKPSRSIPHLPNIDNALRSAIETLSKGDLDYWTFRRGTARAGDYALYQYPAMMVPDMPRQLLDLLLTLQGTGVRRLLDPFVGSGTVLREGMLYGLDVTGLDINPLAVLLTQVKAGPLRIDELEDSLAEVLTRAREDQSDALDVDFPGRDKWFRVDVARRLSRIRRAIMQEQRLWLRRLMWVTFAETVRLTSNSRTSTYKLHMRPVEQITSSERDPIAIFSKMAVRTVEQMSKLRFELSMARQLHRDSYKQGFDVRLQDTAVRVLPSTRSRLKYDLVITSPPYGDNTSTVPYGQSSYLPLQWIHFPDIGDGTVDPLCLRTTNEIDRRSLGGVSPRDWLETTAQLAEMSPTFAETVQTLRAKPPDRLQRITVFLSDLDCAARSICAAMRANGYMVWTVGNRRVGGQEIQTHRVLAELMDRHQAELVHSVERNIVSKRMAHRNAIAATMDTEKILFFRKRE